MEHRIFIDVSEFDIEKKKRVQDAFFKLGYEWLESGYQYLDRHVYTTIKVEGYTNGSSLFLSLYNIPSPDQQPYVKTYNELMEIAGMSEFKEGVEITAEEAQKRLQREEKLAHIQSLKEEVKRAQEALEVAEKELEE